MIFILGFAAIAALSLAIDFLGPERPLAPKWMRVVAGIMSVAALCIGIVAPLESSHGPDQGRMLGYMLGGGALIASARLMLRAFFGRMGPPIRQAEAKPGARPAPRARSR